METIFVITENSKTSEPFNLFLTCQNLFILIVLSFFMKLKVESFYFSCHLFRKPPV